MSTIIECPACSTRYKMNKPIPEGGRSVKCARCGHQWRMLPEEPEELTEALDGDDDFAESESGEANRAEASTVASHGEYAGHSDAFAERAGTYYPDSSAAQTGPSWEVRRGNLAAALASMSDSVEPSDDIDATPGQDAVGEQWQDDAGYQDDTGYQDDAGYSASEDSLGYQTSVAEESEAGIDPFAATEPEERMDVSSSSAFEEGLGAGRHESRWMQEDAADARSAEPAEMDPENSVREVLRAAFADPETTPQDQYDPQGVESSISRPVFSDPDAEEQNADPGSRWSAKAEEYEVPSGGQGDRDDHHLDASQKAFSDRWATFSAAERETQEDEVGAALAATAEEDTEKFENDIAGIFRQQMESKRSFGHAPRPRTSGDAFTDYDMEAGQGSSPSDDRYMADSPLDADAAALQAALEGSLRDRHTEEARSGAGGLALAAAWAVFLSVLSGVTLAFVNFRDDIVVALPGMAGLYRSVGLGVQDQQIDFGSVNYRWTVADGKPMIEVTGQIINLTDREIPVPRVLINVRDKDSADPVKATATLRSDPLAARETADFTLEFISPSKTVSQIELAFAETNE